MRVICDSQFYLKYFGLNPPLPTDDPPEVPPPPPEEEEATPTSAKIPANTGEQEIPSTSREDPNDKDATLREDINVKDASPTSNEDVTFVQVRVPNLIYIDISDESDEAEEDPPTKIASERTTNVASSCTEDPLDQTVEYENTILPLQYSDISDDDLDCNEAPENTNENINPPEGSSTVKSPSDSPNDIPPEIEEVKPEIEILDITSPDFSDSSPENIPSEITEVKPDIEILKITIPIKPPPDSPDTNPRQDDNNNKPTPPPPPPPPAIIKLEQETSNIEAPQVPPGQPVDLTDAIPVNEKPPKVDPAESTPDEPNPNVTMKTEPQNSKNSDNKINGDGQLGSPLSSSYSSFLDGSTSKKDNDLKDLDGPNQVLTWITQAPKIFAPKIVTNDIKDLEDMISLYMSRVTSCISKCYVPNRAAKMKRSMTDMLLFFNFVYSEIPPERKVHSTYLDQMTELMAYYIDMELQASSRAKENPIVVATKISASLFLFLDQSHDHILDCILKTNNMNRNFWELSCIIFGGILHEIPTRIIGELMYVRYILVYKMWKKVAQGPEERKKILAIASNRLKYPPDFMEKLRAGLLNGIIPKVPKKSTDITTFLIQAKFDVKEKAKAFLKYVSESKTNLLFVPAVPTLKTDIPLLVGYLPEFGPSVNFLKLKEPVFDDSFNRKRVDVTGSRLMNEIWTSVNHEASFREAVRMQSVTTITRLDVKLKEKKRMLKVLKHRRGRVKIPMPVDIKVPMVREKRVPDVVGTSTCDTTTIVLSDDGEHTSNESIPGVESTTGNSESSIDKAKRCLPIVAQVHKSEPQPASPDSPASPAPVPDSQTIILPPSHIKQEVDINDGIIESLSQQTVDEGLAVDNKEAVVSNVSNSSTKDLDASMPLEVDDIRRRGECEDLRKEDSVSYPEPMPDLKEEETIGPPMKETELNIRINRDLFEKIKCTNDIDKDPLSDEAIAKSAENPSTELERKLHINVDIEDSQPLQGTSSLEKRTESLLFDEEDNSWSPSGGNQEFFRNVVDNCISGYLPADETEPKGNYMECATTPTVEPALSLGKRKEMAPCGEDPSTFSQSKKYVDEAALDYPPTKRCRYENNEEMSPAQKEDALDAICTIDQNSTALDANKPPPNEVFQLTAAHSATMLNDHAVFVNQSKYRLALQRNDDIDPDEVATLQIDPLHGSPNERCRCEQCVGNYDALRTNYVALLDYHLALTTQSINNQERAAALAAADEFAHNRQDDLGDGGNGSNMGNAGGSSTEQPVHLPFKKRKDFSSSTSDRKEENNEPTNDESSRYPNTPMISIAALDKEPNVSNRKTRNSTKGSKSSPSASNNRSSRAAKQPRLDFAPSSADVNSLYSATLAASSCPPTTVEIPQNYYEPPTHGSKPSGGGFPPFSPVLPSLTHYQPAPQPTPHTVESMLSNEYAPTASTSSYSQSRRKPSTDDSMRRSFRTPAELKASFIAEDTNHRDDMPWTNDLQNVALFVRKLSNNSTIPEMTNTNPPNNKEPRKNRRSSRKRK